MPTQTLPDRMNAIAIVTPGGPEALVLKQVETPLPGPGDVLIRVAAAGLNGPDLAQRRGHYDPPPGASPLPGLEVAGEIVAFGPGTTQSWQSPALGLGDRVIALCNGGGYADYVAVPLGQVLPMPEGWDFAAAAALPETMFTIQQTLFDRAGLSAGMSVLVHGASGGIGATAVQMAKAAGAFVIATASGADKMAYVSDRGADAVIDYKAEDIADRVKTLTDRRGVDRIVDIVGGDYLDINIAASAVGGHIVQVSTLGGGKTEMALRNFMMKDLTLSGSTLRKQDSAFKARVAHNLFASVWPAIARGAITPPRLSRFAMADAAAAHAAMEAPGHFGKSVLVTDFGAASAG